MKPQAAVQLTKKMVDSLSYRGEVTTSATGRKVEPRCVLWDAEQRGLGIRVYPSGRKTWVLAYKADGRKHLMRLGDYPALTLEKARDAARGQVGRMAMAKAVNAQDVDPLAERNKKDQAATMSDLVKAFLTQHAEAKRKARTAAEYRRQLEKHVVPEWGTRRVTSIRRADVAALHTSLGAKTEVLANRVLAVVSKMFNFARVKGFVDDGAPNPAQGVERFREHKRDRWVRPGELPRLVEAINEEPNIYTRAALWLYLLTGARKLELLTAKWEDVDLDRGELRIPDPKNRRTHYIPLSEAALSILSDVPRLAGNPYILPGAKEGAHLVNIDKPWRRIRAWATLNQWRQSPQLAEIIDDLKGNLEREPTLQEVRTAANGDVPGGMEDVRIHDLRRTVGSWLASAGESLPLIGKILNHQDVKTTAIYARLAEDPAKRAMEEHGKRIMEAAKGIRAIK